MGDFLHLKTSIHRDLYKLKSGAMKFKIKALQRGLDILLLSDSFQELYKISVGHHFEIINKYARSNDSLGKLENPMFTTPQEYKEYFFTWYNGTIQIGCVDHPERLIVVDINRKHAIGFMRFRPLQEMHESFECIIERSPINLMTPIKKEIEDGELHWVKMNSGDDLPPDAMVGGFENEHLYIARAHHNGSLCPGKFVPSKKTAYIPWGYREHGKMEFEILCGYNAYWIRTINDNIPQNAFIAGYSEVANEPLYIGRAMQDGYLLNGKVHTLYKTCYLPYKDKEIGIGAYEILATGGVTPRGMVSNNNVKIPDLE